MIPDAPDEELPKLTMEADSPQAQRRRKKKEKEKEKKSHRGKYQRFWRIREQWKLLGFFEIKADHEFYEFTCMLKDGLRDAVQNAIDNQSATDVLTMSHYTAVLKQLHEGFEMRTYASTVFARFRQSLGMVETDYQRSLSCENSYLQFVSNSKSNADFFLTNDKRFFLKTQSKGEIHFLLANLSKYIEHLEKYPHSLLVRFLGVHSIIVPQEKKKYFIIMQSIFYPHDRIMERYDIKGCEVGRWTNPAPDGSEIIMVLKDLNFDGKDIFLDQQRDWFIQQMRLDSRFLKELDVIDYSLLVGLQPLHEDEKALNQAVANIIARTTFSASQESQHNLQISTVTETDDGDCISSVTAESSMERLRVPGAYSTVHNLLALYLMQKSSYEMPLPLASGSELIIREIMASQGSYLVQEVSSAETDNDAQEPSVTTSIASLSALQNRRILCSTKNPLHIIDGPDNRYFVGLIDFFTVYGFRKKLENLWKRIRFRGQSFSTVNPTRYSERICRWVEEHTK